jgi:hypothetical protein
MGKLKLLLGTSILLMSVQVSAAFISSGDKLKFDFDFSSDAVQPTYESLFWDHAKGQTLSVLQCCFRPAASVFVINSLD